MRTVSRYPAVRFADASHNALVLEAFSARFTAAQPLQRIQVLVLLSDDHTGRHSVQTSQSWGWKSTEGRETERRYVTNTRHLSSLCQLSLKRQNGCTLKRFSKFAQTFKHLYMFHTHTSWQIHTARSLPCRAGTTLHFARQNQKYLLRRHWRSQLWECSKTHTTTTLVVPTDVV